MTDDLYAICFIGGEEVCRANGELCDAKWCMKTFGYPSMLQECSKDIIVTDNAIYTNSNSFRKIIETLAYEEDGTYRLNADSVSDLEIYPLSTFYQLYPRFNYNEYVRYDQSLDYYYENKLYLDRDETN